MRHLRPRRPSPALVISLIALFVAIGGTGYAAFKLGKNTVGAAQIRTGAVRSPEVKNKSLKTVDFSSAAISALSGKTGPAGPAGTQGLKGDKGDAGPTFTAFGQNTTNGALPGDGIVSDLVGSNGGAGSGALTLPQQSRVYISGTATLTNISGTEPIRARCSPNVSAAGATTLPTPVGPNTFMDMHQADTDSTGVTTQLHQPIAVTGSALLAAGTYNIGVVCVQIGGSGGGTVNRFDSALNVIAVPATS